MTIERRQWMGILARSSEEALEKVFASLPEPPGYQLLRPAEAGLVMVRGQAGGSGTPFNFGEMTVTRCAVQLSDGSAGFGYVAGRATRKAELAALFDALLQNPLTRPFLMERLIHPQQKVQKERKKRLEAQARGTQVEFFTMVRGDDE